MANSDLLGKSKTLLKLDLNDQTNLCVALLLSLVGLNRIVRRVKDYPLAPLQVEVLLTCELCLEGKR